MNYALRTVVLTAVGIACGGCCYFRPCDPFTDVVGVVRSADGRAIETATVSLFTSSRSVGKSGCFAFRRGSNFPEKLAATAPGYRPLEAPVKHGMHHATIVLEAVNSPKTSRVSWRKISEEQQELQRRECP
jgi:hypothetical protein